MVFNTAICPSCGASIAIPSEGVASFCQYCGNQIVTIQAINKLKQEQNGAVNVEDGSTFDRLLERARTFVILQHRLEAVEQFRQLINKYPNRWAGWWEYCKYSNFSRAEKDRLFNATMILLKYDETQKRNIAFQYYSQWSSLVQSWLSEPGVMPFQYPDNETDRLYTDDNPIFAPTDITNDMGITHLHEVAICNAKLLNKTLAEGITGFGLTWRQKEQDKTNNLRTYIESLILNPADFSDFHFSSLHSVRVVHAIGGKITLCSSSLRSSYKTFQSRQNYQYPDIMTFDQFYTQL